jgi:cytochrome P450
MKEIVSETMRFESPLQMGRRKVAAPVHFLGRELKAGDNVLLCLGSANRDERVFEEASRFIPNAATKPGNAPRGKQRVTALDGEAKWSNRSLILRTLETLPLKID